MRYQPDDPAFAGDFVEFSDSWSRAQVRAAWDALPNSVADATDNHEARLLDALRPKIIALHLTCEGAPHITDPAELTPKRTEDMDTRLFGWWSQVWIKHLGDLTKLGNALGRQLWNTSDTSNQTTKTKPQPTAHRKNRRS